MMLSRIVLFALTPTLIALGAPQEVFDIAVERVRLLRDQPGDLHIDSQGGHVS